jgi:glyoxylase-like metal-dependent hydrolase (beta-lactamase superfamily II)
MVVHHLNCGTMCPVAARFMVGGDRLIAHVVAVETSEGLALVDSGFGLADVRDPRRLGRPFTGLVRPKLSEDETAIRQLEQLGYKASDVRHIAITHLDLDHASGLGDFPDATVHIMSDEHSAATGKWDPRYLRAQWAHGPKWKIHSVEGDRWMGFDAVRAIADEVLMIPLGGHSRGHSGVAVKKGDRWLLHAGDSYFSAEEMNLESPTCPFGLRVFQGLTQFDKKKRLANQQRVFSAHDPVELERAREKS